MDMNDKKQEWLDLLAKCGNELTPEQFIENAKRAESAFHDDFTWNPREAAKQYYQKRAADLIRRYSTIFNTVSAGQRLYKVPLPGKLKPTYKTAKKILRTEEERAAVVAWLWSRLRMVTRDIEPFAKLVPEFAEIHEFLSKRVAMPEALRETVGAR